MVDPADRLWVLDIIVVDLATGASWRRLHEHPSTKAKPLAKFRPVVEGRPFLERPADGEPKPVSMGCDATPSPPMAPACTTARWCRAGW
ncbi:hypothetical protein KBX37_20815 [Micromonospora sp. U56]|uniref:hypothetical protein n=1 Tax=Micromonospora sp. U56 TaxID=2824900 RepID=UPI001B36BA30|nr:hypothetical protein [Micromonospora sp. U56]MBQ0895510.1 hypothetical protein [Micromonospora sp. U56]